MSLGLILEISFVWSLLLAATGLVMINLSINVGRFLKEHGRTQNKELPMKQRTK